MARSIGPINSIVLSRAGESDNVYLRDEDSVEENGLCEVKIVDNQIMNFNDRSDYLQGILNALNGFYYYINDFSSTGILYYDVYDVYDIQVGNNTYKSVMLNDEIGITQGIEELVHTDMPEQSETDYTKADKTDRQINKTYIIVDKQNQTIESVVSNVSEQNTKIARITQTVDELNSKISDIADITTSQETVRGSLIFQDINQSEPIRIEIYPINENITLLYPRNNLYPANNLYIQLRTLRFTNTTTGEVFDYELPDDLLIYDENNYDTFIMDYDSQTCYINKKCAYDSNGNVVLRASEITEEFSFTHINLTDGDYTVQILKYDNRPYIAYLNVRLMAQNIYTTQFATKVEMHSEISQTADSITANVNQTLTNYSTTSQMNSAINLKANEITSSVSETYETKANASNTYATKTQLASSIEQTATSITSSVSETYETKANASDTYATKTTTNSLSSRIKQTAKTIELTTTDNRTSAGITIKLKNEDGTQIDSKSANITLSGLVKFTDLSTSGSTTINGANITTGKISAARLELTDYLTITSASNTYATKSGLSGGTTTISGNCLTTGTINASKCTITNINASNITTGTISASKISGGSLNLTGTNTTITSTNFSVDKNGNITAKGGTIGGFSIDQYALWKDNGSGSVGICSTSGQEYAFWAGATKANSGNAPFRVGHNGSLFASNATISGTITATSGTFENCEIKKTCIIPASTVSGQLATNNIPNLSASKITSGTMSGDRISGGTITGSSISAMGVSADTLQINSEYGSGRITVGNSQGQNAEIIVLHEGQYWRKLVFKQGILTAVLSSW